MRTSLRFLLLVALLPSALFAKAIIDESAVERTVTVDQSGNGDFKTIGEAFTFLNQNPDLAVRVLIQPGVYREAVTPVNPRHAAVTIIEGTSPDEVIINGADICSDWTDEGEGRYSAPWTNDWPIAGEKIAHSTDFYDKHVTAELAKRTEIVFWDEDRMLQVDTLQQLEAGSFFVDGENDKLWLMPMAEQTIDDAQIEVSVRHQHVWFRQVNNFVLRNITFMRAANGSQHGSGQFAVAIFGNTETGDFRVPENHSKNIRIENCRFHQNNGSGITFANYEQVSVIDSEFSENGISGAGMTRLRYVEVRGNSFTDNSWRIGGYGNFYDWVPAGVKYLQCADMVIEDSVFEGNLSTGLWLDWQLERVFIRNIQANNNAGPGLYIEASIGPFVVSNSEFIGNGTLINSGVNHGGILIAESRNVTVTDCLIAENSHGQVVIRSTERGGGVGGYFSGKRFDGSVKDISLVNNVMIGKTITPPDHVRAGWFKPETQSSGGLIMSSTHSKEPLYENEFLSTLWADGNTYYHPDTDVVFSVGPDWGWTRVSLEEWQSKYGLDSGSKWDASLSKQVSALEQN